MKILIYVVVFFIYSVLKPFVDDIIYDTFSATYGPGSDTTALYCGLCAALFAVSAYLCARWLCKLWDQRQAEKAALAASESPDPAPLPAEQEPTIVDPTSPAPTTPKLRFCKLCGSPVDPTTRKCTGCGKQYFRPPVFRKKHLAIAAGVLAFAAIALLIFGLAAQLISAEAKVEELNAQIAELNTKLAEQEDISDGNAKINSALKSTFDDLQKRYNELYTENANMVRKCNFYDALIVLMSADGSTIYHKYGCPFLVQGSGIHVYTIHMVRDMGYKPCSHCCS